MSIRRVVVICAALSVLAFAAINVSPTFAAKGGKGRNGGGTPKATLAVTPSTPSPYTYIHISGCGYAPNAGVAIGMQSPTGGAIGYGGIAGADGCFATDSWSVQGTGNYTVTSYQVFDGRTQTLMGSHSFVVQ